MVSSQRRLRRRQFASTARPDPTSARLRLSRPRYTACRVRVTAHCHVIYLSPGSLCWAPFTSDVDLTSWARSRQCIGGSAIMTSLSCTAASGRRTSAGSRSTPSGSSTAACKVTVFYEAFAVYGSRCRVRDPTSRLINTLRQHPGPAGRRSTLTSICTCSSRPGATSRRLLVRTTTSASPLVKLLLLRVREAAPLDSTLSAGREPASFRERWIELRPVIPYVLSAGAGDIYYESPALTDSNPPLQHRVDSANVRDFRTYSSI